MTDYLQLIKLLNVISIKYGQNQFLEMSQIISL